MAVLPADHPGRNPLEALARRLVVLAAVLFLGGLLAGASGGDPLLALGVSALAAEQGEADEDGECDCPDDDEDGECPSGCDACVCCPAAAPPASSSPALIPVFARTSGDARFPGEAAEPPDGSRRRLFRPPRS